MGFPPFLGSPDPEATETERRSLSSLSAMREALSACSTGGSDPSGAAERGALIRAEMAAAEPIIAEIARARGGLRQSQPLPTERLPEMAAAGGEAGQGEDKREQTGRPYERVPIRTATYRQSTLDAPPNMPPKLQRAWIRRRDGSCNGVPYRRDGEGNEMGSEEEESNEMPAE